VVLLENLRFHPEEEKNDPGFFEILGGVGGPVRSRRVRRGSPGPRQHGGRAETATRARQGFCFSKNWNF
jgi:hypothetical protein